MFRGNVCNSLMIRVNVFSGKIAKKIIAKEIKEEKFKLKEEK